ncbi:hypothetical protein CEXT_773151 [Caerostris extrusa]|uniref:Uncharacterized protein n=1 Tax=Caerostris extrusa TaxID=172846 RepID=A0AAV4QK83_CAEEX|nr:hypothetical protein CEXT_773151 [Caerostris extrusa]
MEEIAYELSEYTTLLHFVVHVALIRQHYNRDVGVIKQTRNHEYKSLVTNRWIIHCSGRYRSIQVLEMDCWHADACRQMGRLSADVPQDKPAPQECGIFSSSNHLSHNWCTVTCVGCCPLQICQSALQRPTPPELVCWKYLRRRGHSAICLPPQ